MSFFFDIDRGGSIRGMCEFLFMLLTGVEAVGGCGSGWILRPGSQTCYNFVTTQKASWSQAQGLCRDMLSHLAILDSKDDIVWMKGYRIHHPVLRDESYWIGGYQKDGEWLWAGDIVDYPMLVFDWSDNNPDNARYPEGSPGSQDCVSQYPASAHFTWDDNSCTNKLRFICEKDLK